MKRVSGRKLLAAVVTGAAVLLCAPSRPFTRPVLLHHTTVVVDSVPVYWPTSNATYTPPPV